MGPLTPTDLDAAAFVHQEHGMLADLGTFCWHANRVLLCQQNSPIVNELASSML